MSHKILIVDDSSETRDLLSAILEGAGYEVIVAQDGSEGLEMARTHSPDIILLDLMLPKINGYKVCRLLKFDAKYKQSSIIILTARSEEFDENTGYEVGADYYLNKPVQADVILAKISDSLKHKDNGRLPLSGSSQGAAEPTG